jgi:deoxyhypusine monooxygenase
MATLDKNKILQLEKILSDSSLPMARRMRAVFNLRSFGSDDAVDALKNSLRDPSALLAHEVAYCLGQMCNAYAIPFLIDALKDTSLNPMVRHEAGEALGAIGSPESIPVLQYYANDPIPEVAETCQVALELISWKQQHPEKSNANADSSVWFSVDPAPPEEVDESLDATPHHSSLNSHRTQLRQVIEKLKQQLLNRNLSLFKRYRALFALRNLGTPDAVAVHNNTSFRTRRYRCIRIANKTLRSEELTNSKM